MLGAADLSAQPALPQKIVLLFAQILFASSIR